MHKRTIGLILILLGIVISVCLLVDLCHDSYLQWLTLDSFKAEEFPYWGDFFMDWYLAESLSSIAIGTAFVFIGIRLRWQQHRKIIGLILILLGILIFVSLVTLDTIHDWRLWITNDTGKAEQFPTFLAYWWNFNKSTTLLCFILGAIPFCIGLRLHRQQPHGRYDRFRGCCC